MCGSMYVVIFVTLYIYPYMCVGVRLVIITRIQRLIFLRGPEIYLPKVNFYLLLYILFSLLSNLLFNGVECGKGRTYHRSFPHTLEQPFINSSFFQNLNVHLCFTSQMFLRTNSRPTHSRNDHMSKAILKAVF